MATYQHSQGRVLQVRWHQHPDHRLQPQRLRPQRAGIGACNVLGEALLYFFSLGCGIWSG